MKKKTLTVEPGAYYPLRGSTSVFRKSRMSETLFDITKVKLDKGRKESLKGVALIEAIHVYNQGLRIVPDEFDHKWHADIDGWPNDEDEDMRESNILAKATALAKKSTLELYN